MISATETKKRIKFKKPLFFSSVFFLKTHESVSEKGIYYISNKEIYTHFIVRRRK